MTSQDAPGSTSPDGGPSRDGSATFIAPYFFLFLFAMSVVGVGYVFLPFVGDLVVALLVVVLLRPVYQRLLRRLGGRALVASALMVSALMVVGAVPLLLVSSALLEDIQRAAAAWNRPGYPEDLRDLFTGHGAIARSLRELAQRTGVPISPEATQRALADGARAGSQWLYLRANAFVAGLVSVLLHTLITLFSIFYLFIDGLRLRAFLFRLSPLPDDEDELFITKLREVGRAIIVGNGIGSALQGLLAAGAWTVVGLPSPVLWGLLMTVAAFLPLVGLAAVVVPATLYLWFTGHQGAAAGFFVFCMVEMMVLEYGLKPRLMGSSLRMNNLLVFLSLLGGIFAFGPLGLLYGPLFVALFLALAELYDTRYQQRIARRLSAVLPAVREP